MSAATRVAGASAIGNTAAAGAFTCDASAPSRKIPSARDVLAARRPTGTARAAHAALGVGVDRHALADRQAVDAGADRLDPADELVAHHHADVRGMAGWHVQDLEVRAADPAGLDLDDDIVVGLDDRLWDVLELDDARALEHRGLHQPTWRRRRIRP